MITPESRKNSAKWRFREIFNRIRAHTHKRIAEAHPDDDQGRAHLAALVVAVIDGMPEPCDHLPAALRIVAEGIELRRVYEQNPEMLTTH